MFIKKDFDLCRFDIDIKRLPCSIFFIGDVHKGSPDHAADAWRKTLRRIKATKNAYIIGMGDYVEMCSASEKKALAAGLHESTENILDEIADKHVRDFIKDVRDTGAEVIALLEGNHFWQYQTGETSTMRMARELGCSYLGAWLGVVGLFMSSGKGGNLGRHIDVVVHHGKGAGKLPGGSINNINDLRMLFEGDIYAMGHDHQCGTFLNNRLVTAWQGAEPTVRARPQMLLRTGSFLRSYNPGGQGYLTKRAAPPAHLGCIKLDLSIKARKHMNAPKEMEFEATVI